MSRTSDRRRPDRGADRGVYLHRGSQQMGFGVAIGLLVDATVVRSILVPA